MSPEQRPGGPTMEDVARRAKVSTATVSRALGGHASVAPATRERILGIAEELAYVVSPEASSLARRSTRRVAVVVPQLDTWFYSSVLAAIEREARSADVDLLIYQISSPEERQRFFRDLPARRKVDGVILTSFPLPPDEAARLELMGVRVVVAGGRLLDHPHVCVDDEAVGFEATGHLLGLGHRRIAMIGTSGTETAWWSVDTERRNGYLRALAEAGVEADDALVRRGPFSAEYAARAMADLLALPDPPTAVFAYSDELAFGAIRHLQDAGLRVPEDISVVGVDDHPLAALFDLTTVAQAVPTQGRLAGRLVLDLIADAPVDSEQIEVPAELVVRGSTGPVPVGSKKSR